MIELFTVEACEPTAEMFNLFKQDASIPDDHRDAVLRTKLRAALSAVQNVSGRTLLPGTLRLKVTEREDNGPVKLYRNVSEILSVQDGTGSDIGYKADGCFIQPDTFTSTVVVTYKTCPDFSDVLRLHDVVSRYTTALYDNEDPDTLNRILAAAWL